MKKLLPILLLLALAAPVYGRGGLGIQCVKRSNSRKKSIGGMSRQLFPSQARIPVAYSFMSGNRSLTSIAFGQSNSGLCT